MGDDEQEDEETIDSLVDDLDEVEEDLDDCDDDFTAIAIDEHNKALNEAQIEDNGDKTPLSKEIVKNLKKSWIYKIFGWRSNG